MVVDMEKVNAVIEMRNTAIQAQATAQDARVAARGAKLDAIASEMAGLASRVQQLVAEQNSLLEEDQADVLKTNELILEIVNKAQLVLDLPAITMEQMVKEFSSPISEQVQ